MPASIVLVHEHPNFVEEATTALEERGYSVAAFLDPMRALEAVDRAQKMEVLITGMTFAPGKPNGVSLARITLRQKRDVRIIFIGDPETRSYAEELGAFVAWPATGSQVLEELNRVLRFSLLRLMAVLRATDPGKRRRTGVAGLSTASERP